MSDAPKEMNEGQKSHVLTRDDCFDLIASFLREHKDDEVGRLHILFHVIEFLKQKGATDAQAYNHALARWRGESTNNQKDNLAALLERAKTHHLQAGMEVTLTIAELERMLNDFLDVASKEPKFDSRDFLFEALSNLNEERQNAKFQPKR